MNPKPPGKLLKSLSDEQKARYRGAILRAEIASIKVHANAKSVLWSLATRGCDVALLWTLLAIYRAENQGRIHKEERQEVEGTRRRLATVAKKFGQLSKAISTARESSAVDEEKDLFDDLAAKIDEMTQSVKAADQMLSRHSNSRGVVRPEQFLHRAATYLRANTGQQCYEEIATVLECVDAVRGVDAVSNAGSIRRICERYSKGLKGYGNDLLNADRLLRICDGDELASILREEILVAIVSTPERQGRKKS